MSYAFRRGLSSRVVAVRRGPLQGRPTPSAPWQRPVYTTSQPTRVPRSAASLTTDPKAWMQTVIGRSARMRAPSTAERVRALLAILEQEQQHSGGGSPKVDAALAAMLAAARAEKAVLLDLTLLTAARPALEHLRAVRSPALVAFVLEAVAALPLLAGGPHHLRKDATMHARSLVTALEYVHEYGDAERLLSALNTHQVTCCEHVAALKKPSFLFSLLGSLHCLQQRCVAGGGGSHEVNIAVVMTLYDALAAELEAGGATNLAWVQPSWITIRRAVQALLPLRVRHERFLAALESLLVGVGAATSAPPGLGARFVHGVLYAYAALRQPLPTLGPLLAARLAADDVRAAHHYLPLLWSLVVLDLVPPPMMFDRRDWHAELMRVNHAERTLWLEQVAHALGGPVLGGLPPAACEQTRRAAFGARPPAVHEAAVAVAKRLPAVLPLPHVQHLSVELCALVSPSGGAFLAFPAGFDLDSPRHLDYARLPGRAVALLAAAHGLPRLRLTGELYGPLGCKKAALEARGWRVAVVEARRGQDATQLAAEFVLAMMAAATAQ